MQLHTDVASYFASAKKRSFSTQKIAKQKKKIQDSNKKLHRKPVTSKKKNWCSL